MVAQQLSAWWPCIRMAAPCDSGLGHDHHRYFRLFIDTSDPLTELPPAFASTRLGATRSTPIRKRSSPLDHRPRHRVASTSCRPAHRGNGRTTHRYSRSAIAYRSRVKQTGRMTDEAIPVLRVADVAVAVDWYERLGYAKEWQHRFDPSFPAFVSLARNGVARLFLSEHSGDAQPDTLVYLRVSDVDAIAQEFGLEIVTQPWGREVHVTDPDGNRLRVGEATSA